MLKRILIPTLASLALAAAVALVGPAQDAAAEGGEGTLVWGMPAETDILDPHATGGWLTYDVTYQIFESFAKEDLTDPNAATPELIPALATSWEISEDGLEYTFYLREGVKFHDGTPFDAAVAKFNFDRFWNESSPHFYAKSKAFVAAYTRWIENVEVIDDMTIKVTLNAPNYEWIRSGLQSYGQPLMISPTAVETFGNEGVALNPIGTGPFKFVEREQGVKTVIERNPDYWGRKAKLDRVIFRPLEDPATRINALRTGEIDMTNTPPWDDIQDLVDEGFHLTINENVPFIWFIHLNNRHPILQDVRVRRAMNMAVDRESLVREIFAGTGRAEYGMLSPGTVAYDPNFSSYDYDPEGAKALLAEAGYPEGFELQFDTFQYGLGDVVEQWVARDLGKIGIKVDVKKYEWISYMHEWAGGLKDDVGMNEIGWGMTVPSWIGIVARCSSHPPGGVNSGWYCNEEVDKLLDQGAAARDPAMVRELYQKANRIIMDEAGFIPLLDDMQPIFTSDRVKGLVNPAEDWVDLSTVELVD